MSVQAIFIPGQNTGTETLQVRWLVSSTEKLLRRLVIYSWGSQWESHHPCALYGPYVDPEYNQQTKRYSSREVGYFSGVMLLFLIIVDRT